MGSIIGHRIDFNGVGALRGQRQIPSKNLHFGAVWTRTGIRTVAEINKKERELEPTETEVNIFKSKDWDL